MDDINLDKAFRQLKQEIPVNLELKQKLRQEYAKPTGFWLRRISIMAALIAAAAVLVFSFVLMPEDVINKASAASLKIANFSSLVEIGRGESIGVTEYGGTVYVPVAGKGLFAYNDSGFYKLFGIDVNFVRVSKDGAKLVFSANGSISIYDIKSKKVKEILKRDNQNIYYEEPVWGIESNSVVYTKKSIKPRETHGFLENNEIFEVNLKTLAQRKIADGSHVAVIEKTNAIIFERDQKVVYKDLKTGKEKIVDTGRFPSVSPEGSYITYVKSENKEKVVGSNAKVVESVDNVWITDTVDFKSRKRVTANFPNYYTDVNEWVSSLKPSDIPQVLGLSGQYSYYEPVWSSGSDSLFIIRNTNAEGSQGMTLVRIDFTTQKQTASDMVRKFLMALNLRNDDYAKSLMKEPPEILTVSNPHQVGYEITGSGKVSGHEYVDAVIHSQYTAQPYYTRSEVRFYLSSVKGEYIIDKIDFVQSTQVIAKEDGGIYLTRAGKETILFKDSDIPEQYKVKGKHRFASLAYDTKTNTLVFTIQILQDKDQKSSVKILSFNSENRKFRLLDEVHRIDGRENIGVESLILDAEGKFAALNLFSDDDRLFKSYCVVYDINKGGGDKINNKLAGIQSVHTVFWNSQYLLIEAVGDGQTMRYMYIPEKKHVSTL